MNWLDFVLAVAPIILLIFLMTKKNSMPSKKALPLVAFITYLLVMIYFQRDPSIVHGVVIAGILKALTPIMIIYGAIFLFRTLEHSGSMNTIRTWLNDVSPNKVAQLMVVGWAFPFLIEGASGFGTPAALAAPVLVGLGFKPTRVAILALIMNSVPVSFGAVGTPTWYGFGELTLNLSEIMDIGAKSGIIHFVAALIIPVIALLMVVKLDDIKKNVGFIYISILSTTVPYILLSFVDYEFPSLVGGSIGLVVSVFAAQQGWGLQKSEDNTADKEHVGIGKLVKALFPLWATILVLVITRVPQLGIKTLITNKEALFSLDLGTFGTFELSKALILSLKGIASTGQNWSFQLLYVPSLVPFIFVSVISFAVFKMKKKEIGNVIAESNHQIAGPMVALFGALAFVNLLMMGGDTSMTKIIGGAMSNVLGSAWHWGAPYMGALGSFFSGSNTVSNLTFSGIQDSIASAQGLSRTTILAMQSVGGAMGNMVCINNIVAVCTVLGLGAEEGSILKKTVVPMLIYGVIAGVVGLFLWA